MMRWALEPPAPKELIVARRGTSCSKRRPSGPVTSSRGRCHVTERLLHIKRRVRERDIGVQGAGFDGRDQLPMAQLHDDLGQLRHTRGRFRVADVGLDRTDRAEAAIIA